MLRNVLLVGTAIAGLGFSAVATINEFAPPPAPQSVVDVIPVPSAHAPKSVGPALGKPLQRDTRWPSTKPAPRTHHSSAAPEPRKPRPIVTQAPEVYYGNCKEMRVDHPDGVPRNNPAYRSALDRDKDGWACEQ